MQNEWKIRKDLSLLFPDRENAVEQLCQEVIRVNGMRYRDFLFQLAKKHHKEVHRFLSEVQKHDVKANDRNWIKRFKALGALTFLVSEPVKEVPKVDSDDDVDDKIEENFESSDSESSDMIL